MRGKEVVPYSESSIIHALLICGIQFGSYSERSTPPPLPLTFFFICKPFSYVVVFWKQHFQCLFNACYEFVRYFLAVSTPCLFNLCDMSVVQFLETVSPMSFFLICVIYTLVGILEAVSMFYGNLRWYCTWRSKCFNNQANII